MHPFRRKGTIKFLNAKDMMQIFLRRWNPLIFCRVSLLAVRNGNVESLSAFSARERMCPTSFGLSPYTRCGGTCRLPASYSYGLRINTCAGAKHSVSRRDMFPRRCTPARLSLSLPAHKRTLTSADWVRGVVKFRYLRISTVQVLFVILQYFSIFLISNSLYYKYQPKYLFWW